MNRISFILLLLMSVANMLAQGISVSETSSESAFPLVHNEAAPIVYDENEAEVVLTIAATVAGDIEAVTGKKPSLSTSLISGTMPVIAGTVGESALINQLVDAGKLNVADVKDKWEAYGLAVVDNPFEGVEKALVAYGSQSRATAYALLEISREIGVSPWIWWADVAPRHKANIFVEGSKVVGEPSVKYRGIFLNDEDWGLTPWAAKNMDKDKNNIGPQTYARIMELLLRLRANTLWPAMHSCSAAFFYYKDNIPVAKKYAIYMGSSHCEQMLRDNEWEWNRYGGHYNDDWNWKTNRQMIQRYWEERVAETVDVNGIYTIGMRGVHDSPMNGYNTTQERVAALTEVIAWQRELLGKYFPDVTKVPQLFIPYKEVLDCYNAGLQIPDDVMLMWVDDNHGYIRQLPKTSEQARSGGNAVYYHLSYWGTPSSYLWLSTISPSLCSFELSKAYGQGVISQWIINVGDIKPAEEELEFCMDLAWDVERWAPDKAWEYTRYWAAKTFGEDYADAFAEIKLEYYRLAAAGKPEHIHLNTYTLEEMEQRIADYELLEEKVEALKSQLPEDLLDAYYQLLEYPVLGASNMNKKQFLAKKSLILARAGERDEALGLAAEARKSYRQIVDLTQKYNTGISNGKWDGMMNYHPQDYACFYMPETATLTNINSVKSEVETTDYRYVSAADYKDASDNVKVMKGLGVSAESIVVWPVETKSYAAAKAPFATYDVAVGKGKNTIQVKCLPSFPLNSNFDLRVAIAVDGGSWQTKSVKTVATQGAWNQTVAQGYSPAEVTFESDSEKTVEVKVALLDPGVAVSQIVCMPEGDDVNELTRELIANYDFELNQSGEQNDGTTDRGIPYGWASEGKLNLGANGLQSYGINSDALNYHGKNLCWINSQPMPATFKLYQTIPAEKLTPGTYRIRCMLWVEEGKKTSCRLFANNNVQYYGYESDYTKLLTHGEVNTYAGYAGLPTSNLTLRDMEVYVTVAEGEDLSFGIKTGNKKNDGTTATDNAGWFKVDFFRIDRVENEIPDDVKEDLTLTEANIVNYDFELYKSGNNVLTNTSGETRRYTPYGWNLQGNFPGDSYGINKDASTPHNVNVCWFLPKNGYMPDDFELYQEIPAGQLEAGRYLVQCKLWVEENYLATTRLFANNNVQYYGMDIDYVSNLTDGEINSFAGYIGGVNGNFILQDMYVYVDLAENEPLRLGIRSSNKRSDGTPNPDYKNGWFKVDYFRINRVVETSSIKTPATMQIPADSNLYDLQGRRINAQKAGHGIYIQNGRKIVKR